MSTQELISKLSQEASLKATLPSPFYSAVRLVLLLVAYGVGVQLFLSTRTDIMVQLFRPMFAIEIMLLVCLIVTSTFVSVLAMYPDAYQKPKFLRLPYGIFVLLFLFIFFQLIAMPEDPRMVFPTIQVHEMRCAVCIASVAFVPAALIFGILKRGASVHPQKTGSFAVLMASGIGCLTLRLAEENDQFIHLVVWHYLPTLLFAICGAAVGKWVLRW